MQVRPNTHILHSALRAFQEPAHTSLSATELRPTVSSHSDMLTAQGLTFVTPPEIAKNEKALAAYEKALKVEADAYKEIRDALAVGYINEKCPDKYSGTDEEIINAYKADDKNPAMLSSRKPMRTQDLFFRMHRQQKLSALSMQEACRTFCTPLLQQSAVGNS